MRAKRPGPPQELEFTGPEGPEILVQYILLTGAKAGIFVCQKFSYKYFSFVIYHLQVKSIIGDKDAGDKLKAFFKNWA